VTGDGYADVAVGAPGVDSPYTNAGVVNLFSGVDGSLIRSLAGLQASDYLGGAVAFPGDLNGDGYGEIAIGRYSPVEGARIYSGLDGSVLYTFSPLAGVEGLAHSMAAVGDVNGDGYGDLLLGASSYSGTVTNGGRAHLYSGANGALLYTVSRPNPASYDAFGDAVAAAGDVNGDGYADVIIGAPGDDTLASNAGAAWIYSGVDGTELMAFHSSSANAGFGRAVAGGVDLNADGYADIVVGAPADTDPRTGAQGGAVHIFSGRDGSLIERRYAPFPDSFGSALALGDVNADGYADLIVGAPNADAARFSSGSAFVLDGPFGMPRADILMTASGDWAPADGASTVTVTVQVKDAAGAPVVGAQVGFLADGYAALSVTSAVTDATGRATVSVSDAVVESVNVDAYVAALSLSTALNGQTAHISFLDPLGDPDGDGLTNATEFTAGTDPNLADTDGDGFSDGVEWNTVPPSDPLNPVSVPLAMAAGTPAVVGTTPERLVAGNFVIDGYADLAVADRAGNAVHILAGDGTGAWTVVSSIPVGLAPVDIASGDFNRDGYADLAVADNASHDAYVMLGDGAGGFVQTQAVALATTVWPGSIAVGDFNIDGYADLAIGVDTVALAFPSSSSVLFYQGDGAGGFAAAGSVSLSGLAAAGPADLVASDVNRDGYTDVVAALAGTNRAVVALNNGGFAFTPSVYPVGNTPRGLAVADINRDGYADLLTANSGAADVSILTGFGAGFNPYVN
ncbi:MAG: FG-GAP-like repeat-containing protein, partial [Mariprofundaceae bacterium]